MFKKDVQYYKFCFYGFLKNLRFFEPFFILFLLEKNLSFLQIGTLYAIREIAVNILEIPSGIFADAFGRRRSLVFSFIFYIASFIIFFFSELYVFFILSMICYAMGDAFRTGTHKAMIFDYLKLNHWKDQRAHYYGHTRSWSQTGTAISSLMAGFIVFFEGNYQSVFLYSTIPYILDMLLILSYPKILDGANKKTGIKQIKKEMVTISKEFITSFKNIYVLRAINNLSVHSGFHKSIKDYLQPVLEIFAISVPVMMAYSQKQKTAVIIGILFFMIYLLTAYGSRKAGKIKDKLKSIELAINLTMYAGFILAIVSGIFYHFSFYLVSAIFFVVIYIVENIRNPIGVAYVSELYKDEILATALSANSQAKSLYAAIIAPVLGFLADKFDIGIALCLIGLVLILTSFFYIARRKP
ncbi:MAG TPA: MFS transporter [Bacteroidales bacterium]|nr:MFS transporter [Bacteroidales bacterium]